MKFTSSCITLLAAVGMCWQSACRSSVQAVYPEKWPEIEAYIRANFLSYVDTTSALPKPYSFALNPGTLYYWDLYFINEGLMMEGFWDQARNNLDNFIFEIEKLGFVPNANGWGEDRSQTPYFSMMVRSFWEKSPQKDTAWLRRAYRAVLQEYEFWTNANGNLIEDHRTPLEGLQRFSNHADTAALIEFYDRVLKTRFKLSDQATPDEKVEVASHRLSEAETMDFTPRFEGRCNDFIPVDLNANLYQYERDLAFYEQELGLEGSMDWNQRAAERAALIDRYLWNEERGVYMDYDFVHQRFSTVASLATLMPLYWGLAPADKADRIRENLSLFQYPGGLVVCETLPQEIHYQWGDAAVWAPMQFIAIGALKNYGYHRQAQEVAMRWLNTVTRNFVDPQPATYPSFKYGDGTRHPGFLYEKYTREGEINDAEYPCSEMMGWTAATFLFALESVQHTGTK